MFKIPVDENASSIQENENDSLEQHTTGKSDRNKNS